MQTYYFASTYGSSSYDGSTYDGASASSATAPSSSSGGLLTNTGTDLVVFVTLAVCIVFVALVVKLWRRPSQPSS